MFKRSWRTIAGEIQILSRIVSLTFLIGVWVILGAIKYNLYGVASWGLEWRIQPSLWNKLEFFVSTHILPYGFLMLIAAVLDLIFWPYFLRKENQIFDNRS